MESALQDIQSVRIFRTKSVFLLFTWRRNITREKLVFQLLNMTVHMKGCRFLKGVTVQSLQLR